MASLTPISQTQFLFNKPLLKSSSPRLETCFQSSFVSKRLCFQLKVPVFDRMPLKNTAVVAATTAEKPKKRYPGEAKGFVEEMRFVAMKLHTREQAKEGEKEVKEKEEEAVRKWEPSIDGYLKFLVDSKLVYDTLEEIVEKASFPFCKFDSCFKVLYLMICLPGFKWWICLSLGCGNGCLVLFR
jgi:heme oxygenase